MLLQQKMKQLLLTSIVCGALVFASCAQQAKYHYPDTPLYKDFDIAQEARDYIGVSEGCAQAVSYSGTREVSPEMMSPDQKQGAILYTTEEDWCVVTEDFTVVSTLTPWEKEGYIDELRDQPTVNFLGVSDDFSFGYFLRYHGTDKNVQYDLYQYDYAEDTSSLIHRFVGTEGSWLGGAGKYDGYITYKRIISEVHNGRMLLRFKADLGSNDQVYALDIATGTLSIVPEEFPSTTSYPYVFEEPVCEHELDVSKRHFVNCETGKVEILPAIDFEYIADKVRTSSDGEHVLVVLRGRSSGDHHREIAVVYSVDNNTFQFFKGAAYQNNYRSGPLSISESIETNMHMSWAPRGDGNVIMVGGMNYRYDEALGKFREILLRGVVEGVYEQ